MTYEQWKEELKVSSRYVTPLLQIKVVHEDIQFYKTKLAEEEARSPKKPKRRSIFSLLNFFTVK
jgi:hypothetical protein